MPTGRKIKRRKLSLLELASGLDGESKGPYYWSIRGCSSVKSASAIFKPGAAAIWWLWIRFRGESLSAISHRLSHPLRLQLAVHQ